ncbi:MAG: carbamate kinase [Coriobacteriales bacterium]|nr:carbamate kinase [Coriobacteriales bacterium]
MPVTKRGADKPRRIVISLGGLTSSSMLSHQLELIHAVAPELLHAIDVNAEVILTHGNGPQIHMAQRAFAVASTEDPTVPPIDLPECGAMTQGYIGYHLQQTLAAEMHKAGKHWHVATVITQIEVDADDPSFGNPTKAIGPRLTKRQADSLMEQDASFKFVKDGEGYRRVVASPRPRRIVESESILNLLDNDFVVIACGGGGIPVVRDSDDLGCYVGVPAVIEKDAAAGLLGDDCDADEFIFLTDVDGAAVNWGKEGQRFLGDITVPEIHAYMKAGEFGSGTMEPKVRAALRFLEQRPDRVVRIGNVRNAAAVVRGEAGTCIHY